MQNIIPYLPILFKIDERYSTGNKRRSIVDRNMVEHNYSELFEGIPIFADISTSILQRYPISGLFPTAHSLTILLSIYEH